MDDLIKRQDAVTLPVAPKRYRKYQTNNLDDAYEQGWEDLQKCIERLPSAQHRPCCYLGSPCPYQNEEIKITQNDELSIAKNLVSNYSPQVLEIALKYAIHLVAYGIDIAEKHETVVQQEEMCSRAYTKGRYDEREAKRCIDCEAFNKSQLLVPQNEHMKWIPCEKKMPEVYQKAIVIDKEGNMMIGTYTNWGWIFPAYFANDPLAWMPLPKPYKEENNG